MRSHPSCQRSSVGIDRGTIENGAGIRNRDNDRCRDRGDPPRALWAVLADTPHLAVEAARASGCEVDRIVGTLSEETVERLGIQPGQPMRL
jgi:hypothetical protein